MKLLQFRIWGGKVEYNHPMYIWASDADTAFFWYRKTNRSVGHSASVDRKRDKHE